MTRDRFAEIEAARQKRQEEGRRFKPRGRIAVRLALPAVPWRKNQGKKLPPLCMGCFKPAQYDWNGVQQVCRACADLFGIPEYMLKPLIQ